MHVLVLGAGVVGVTTAYYLTELGCRVTVVDRADEAAAGTSHANGGQLSYAFSESLATPSFVRKIPALIAGQDFAVKIRLSPRLVPWGLRFLTQCAAGRARSNTLGLLDTAKESARLMSDLRTVTGIDFSYRSAGKIVLLSTDDEVRAAERATRLKAAHGIDVDMLSVVDAEAIEPAIANFTAPLKAAVYSKNDDVGDARLFASELQNYLERERGVEFRFGTPADGLIRSRGTVHGVRCDTSHDTDIAADAVVMCLGAGSTRLLRQVGINPHIYPVRGYSVTLPAGDAAPSASLTSLTNRFVFSRLNGKLRIAGFTDFNGDSSADDAGRVATLVAAAQRLAPGFADYDAAEKHAWGGFRPMTPSGLPLVGASKVKGLYLNTGHGMLGWTLACATARSVADTVSRNH